MATAAASLAEARTPSVAVGVRFPDFRHRSARRQRVRPDHGRLRGLRPIRGIALTGYGTEKDIDRSREAGFAVHLTKPISAQSLDRALAEVNR